MTTTNEQVRDILTPDQAADYLQVNRETIYRYIRDGKLLAFRLGRAYRIPRTSIDALLRSSSTRPDIVLREYGSSELDRFEKDDELTGKAAAIAERFSAVMENKPTPT
jgi:excisionase family DNA binding protein